MTVHNNTDIVTRVGVILKWLPIMHCITCCVYSLSAIGSLKVMGYSDTERNVSSLCPKRGRTAEGTEL